MESVRTQSKRVTVLSTVTLAGVKRATQKPNFSLDSTRISNRGSACI